MGGESDRGESYNFQRRLENPALFLRERGNWNVIRVNGLSVITRHVTIKPLIDFLAY